MSASIALVDPKHARNVGSVVRAASCFDVNQVWITGDRVALEPHPGYRLPREERMRDYQSVQLARNDRFFDALPAGVTPVAVEVMPGAELLPYFEHPEKALYVFGPEDGSLPRVTLGLCHRFVTIPIRHCVNLAAAVHIVLWDRQLKRIQAGSESPHILARSGA